MVKRLYEVKQEAPSDNFKDAWSAAGQHIDKQADASLNWLRAALNLPMAEHLSFRIGNQVFFVFVEAAEFDYQNSHCKYLFDKVCNEANAIPCIMPMKKQFGKWKPCLSGWGFIHAQSNQLLNPLDYVSDELIEMTNWELHDFAIQVVCSDLEKKGKNISARQPSAEIDPSIWFEDSDGLHFIVVRSAKHPESEPLVPNNIEDIKQSCLILSESGYFAPVVFVNIDKNNGNSLPMYRGHGVFVNYHGLQALSKANFS